MDNNSIERHQVGDLHYTDEVVVDCNLSSYLDKHTGGEVSGDVSIAQHDLSILSGNIVQTNGSFVGGEGSTAERNSFAYGTGVSAIGENSYAVGKDSIAGCYGWYYKYLDLTTGTFYLTTEQPDVKAISAMGEEPEVDTTFESGFAVGDVISYVNKNKRDMYATVATVNGNKLVVGKLTDSVVQIEEEHPNHDDWTIFVPEKPMVGQIWLGECAFAEGSESKAINAYSHAEGGKGCLAYGQYSHAEGKATEAGYAAHTEGEQTKAKGARSHAEGYDTIASGSSSHTEGQHTKAVGQAAHAEGHSAIAVADDTVNKNADGIIADWKQQKFSLAKGTASHIEGKDNLGLGEYSHAEGLQTTALGPRAHTEGSGTFANGNNAHAEGGGTQAIAENSHSEGSSTTASGNRSHAEGSGSEASENNAHAEGMNTKACGNSSHAEGASTVAGSGDRPSANSTNTEGFFSHAEGNGTFAKGNSSHAEGKSTQALKPYSHAEGLSSTADGNKSHAEGWQTIAGGDDSHAEGGNTQTQNRYEHAQGSYNKSNKANTKFGNAGNTLHSIGIGTSESDRKNAVEVMQDGKVFVKGIGSYDGKNPTADNVKDLAAILGTLDSNLSNYLDKHSGGEVSGAVGIVQHDIEILSGNYIQTSMPDSIANYASKNAIIQADADPHYGDSYAGTKAFCILGLSTATNQIKLSGDIQVLKDIVDGRLSVGDMPVDIGKSRSMRNVFGKDTFKEGDLVTDGTNMSAAMFSLTLDDRAASMAFHLSAVDVESGVITLKESLKDADGFDTLDGHTTSFFEDLWLNDDNAFYLVGFPELGNANVPNNFGQFASGGSVRAIGRQTHAEGRDSIADIRYAHVEGSHCTAAHMATHAEGFRTVASKRYSHSEGEVTKADGRGSHAEGYKTIASGDYSHAEGGFDKSSGGSAIGAGSHAEGMLTHASGIVAHAEGNQTQASASGAHAEGQKSVASGNYSHAEGNATSAMTEYSHAEGNGSVVSGLWSHAEGYQTSAFGNYSHAEGRQTVAGKAKDGDVAATYAAHAEGFGTKALGVASHASGVSADVSDDYAFAWNGINNKTIYASHGVGTFNINPQDGLSGFYIGHDNFIQCVLSAVQAMDETQINALKAALGI